VSELVTETGQQVREREKGRMREGGERVSEGESLGGSEIWGKRNIEGGGYRVMVGEG
jgi:hypothetical protein